MLNKHSGAAAAAAALFLCALATLRADAAAKFSVSPLALTLRADKLATSLTLGNQGREPVTVQTRLLAWTQDAGDDAYTDASGLVVSPPIFKIAPGAQQVVRVGRLKRGKAPEREQAFRILLSEVPGPAQERTEAVTTFMQLSLPIFVPPADRNAKAAVDVHAASRGDDLALEISNSGLVHDKLTRLVLSHDGKPLAERTLNYYVLSGARRQLLWPGVLASAPPGALVLRVQLDGRNRFLTRPLTRAPVAPAPDGPRSR